MPPPPTLATTVVPTLGDLSGEWDGLVVRAPLPSPFLRSWWLGATRTKTASHLLFRDSEGTLVGGVPVVEDRHLGARRIRFWGSGVLCPDHLDLLAQEEASDQVGESFMTWVTQQRNVVIDLTGLVQGSLVERVVPHPVEVVDVAPYAVLPPDAEDYLSTRSSGTRRSVRRSDRRLAAAGAQHRRIAPDRLSAALDDFRRLQEARPDRAPLLAELPTLARALEGGLRAGEARVDVLETDGRPLAVSLAFVVAGRLSLYQVARSLEREDDGAGTVLLHRVVEDAVRDGCGEVDLLRGDEGYKSSLADDRRSIGRIRFARGPVAAAVLSARDAAASARRRVVRSV